LRGGVLKQDPFCGQAVDVGRLDQRIAVATDMVGAGCIEGEKEDVEVGWLERGDPPADLGRRAFFAEKESFGLNNVKKGGQSSDPGQDDEK
jgi:hypothetical protein